MPTRNVVLTEPQERLIDALLESGRYQNASEVIRAGLRLLEHHEASLQDIRAGLMEGLAQKERGALLDGETAIREAFERAKARSNV